MLLILKYFWSFYISSNSLPLRRLIYLFLFKFLHYCIIIASVNLLIVPEYKQGLKFGRETQLIIIIPISYRSKLNWIESWFGANILKKIGGIELISSILR